MRYGKDAVLKTVILSHDGLTVTTVTSQWKKDGRERRVTKKDTSLSICTVY